MDFLSSMSILCFACLALLCGTQPATLCLMPPPRRRSANGALALDRLTKLTGGTGNNEVVVQVVTGKAHIARTVNATLDRKRKQEDRAVQAGKQEGRSSNRHSHCTVPKR